MSTLIRQRALQTSVLSICIIAILLSRNFFYIVTVHSFLYSLLKFYSKQKFVLFCYLVVFISTLLFCKWLPVLPGFVVKNDAVQYRSMRWEKSHEIVIKMLRVEKVGAHAAFWENLWAKSGPNRASIDSSEKRITLDYQLTVLLVKVVRTTFSENSEPVWDVHVRIHVGPLACYPFINIKLAAYHLLLYVVYLCQKS